VGAPEFFAVTPFLMPVHSRAHTNANPGPAAHRPMSPIPESDSRIHKSMPTPPHNRLSTSAAHRPPSARRTRNSERELAGKDVCFVSHCVCSLFRPVVLKHTPIDIYTRTIRIELTSIRNCIRLQTAVRWPALSAESLSHEDVCDGASSTATAGDENELDREHLPSVDGAARTCSVAGNAVERRTSSTEGAAWGSSTSVGSAAVEPPSPHSTRTHPSPPSPPAQLVRSHTMPGIVTGAAAGPMPERERMSLDGVMSTRMVDRSLQAPSFHSESPLMHALTAEVGPGSGLPTLNAQLLASSTEEREAAVYTAAYAQMKHQPANDDAHPPTIRRRYFSDLTSTDGPRAFEIVLAGSDEDSGSRDYLTWYYCDFIEAVPVGPAPPFSSENTTSADELIAWLGKFKPRTRMDAYPMLQVAIVALNKLIHKEVNIHNRQAETLIRLKYGPSFSCLLGTQRRLRAPPEVPESRAPFSLYF